jgi:hypothetical protein
VLLLLDPPHALRTSATMVAVMARKVVYGMASLARSWTSQHSEEEDAPSSIDLPDVWLRSRPVGWSRATRELVDAHPGT